MCVCESYSVEVIEDGRKVRGSCGFGFSLGSEVPQQLTESGEEERRMTRRKRWQGGRRRGRSGREDRREGGREGGGEGVGGLKARQTHSLSTLLNSELSMRHSCSAVSRGSHSNTSSNG